MFNFLQGTQISSFYMNLIRTDAFLQKNYDNNEKYYRNSSSLLCLFTLVAHAQLKMYHPSYSPLRIRVLWNFLDKKWPTEVAGSHVTTTNKQIQPRMPGYAALRIAPITR